VSGQRVGIVEPRVGWMERGRAPRGWGLWPSHPAGAPRRGAGSVVEAEALSAKGTTGLQQMPRLPEQVGMLSSIPSVQPPVPSHRPRPAPPSEDHPPLKGVRGHSPEVFRCLMVRSPCPTPWPESGMGRGRGTRRGPVETAPPSRAWSPEGPRTPAGPALLREVRRSRGAISKPQSRRRVASRSPREPPSADRRPGPRRRGGRQRPGYRRCPSRGFGGAVRSLHRSGGRFRQGGCWRRCSR